MLNESKQKEKLWLQRPKEERGNQSKLREFNPPSLISKNVKYRFVKS